ncbi:hemerythrin domain-containing protein [Chloroflexota bacterium]
MEDNLAIINRIIDWHQTIRGHVKLVGESMSDRETLASLEGVRPDWIPGRPGIPSEKQNKLQQTLSALDDGLKNHFAYEEEVLPPLLGELFVRGLILDHQEIKKESNEAKQIVADIKLEGLSRDDLMSIESRIQQVINNMCNLVEEHAAREEVLLRMLQRALEEKG